MSNFRFEYDDSWIIENYNGRVDTDFVNEYNRIHETDYSKETLRKHIKNKLNICCPNWKVWTQEMDDWLIANYSKVGMLIATNEINRLFNTNISHINVQRRATKHLGIYTDKDIAISHLNTLNGEKKIEPFTIRKQGEYYAIKTGDSYKDWTPYQRYIYEQAHGKLPNGYSVIFLDGNTENFELNNLYAVKRNNVLMMGKMKFFSEEKEVTKCGAIWCELNDALKEKQNGR